jgi:hypothetical protein
MEQAEPSESTEVPEATEKPDIAEANTDDGQEPNHPPDKEESAPGKRKARESTPSNELHIYSVEELSKFKKREMIADAELLDGALHIFTSSIVLIIRLLRETQKCQAQSGRVKGISETRRGILETCQRSRTYYSIARCAEAEI